MSKPEPRSPLANRWPAGRHGAAADSPVTIHRRAMAIVGMQVGPGRHSVLEELFASGLSLTLPSSGAAATVGDLAAVWIAPGQWLLSEPFTSEGALASRLAGIAGDAAAIVEQSHGKTCLRLAGPHARDVLEKLCRIDLHPRAFGPGRTAVTPVAHIACVLHQLDAQPTYDLIMPSSFAVHLLESIEMAAAEYGVVLADG